MHVEASPGHALRARAMRWFGSSHRLAPVAVGWCAQHTPDAGALIGRVVCGACVERALRDEVRAAVDPLFDPVSLPVGTRAPRRLFGPGHVLAPVASRLCRGHRTLLPLVGLVACGPCWEAAIVADELAVAECGLARELAPDPGLIDEVAVGRALRGLLVELTPAESAEAERRRGGVAVEFRRPPAPSRRRPRRAAPRGVLFAAA